MADDRIPTIMADLVEAYPTVYKPFYPMDRPAWQTDQRYVEDEPDYGGAFDGFTVTSDADGGL
jgi:hypothetical protein